MDSGSAHTRIGDAIESARRRLAIEALKKEQEEVVRAFLSGNDVFVSLPTGYGKTQYGRTERQSSLASLCNLRLSRWSSMLLPQSRQRCWLCMTGKN